ncbi:DUF2332 domain-containing protein [Pelagibacterium lentulum]|uniref:DUF2332 domain-containing protein n=1 Tax=Pelagibacterium lentulum TaxID=2029865 RepID=A0A916W0D4_9HYPH|nr:DUF2332 family protein [Pelagibacterium lentulum]GGA56099.1 hypothetical protein GCM10011499_27800 [Pelagibacterium lentulum]
MSNLSTHVLETFEFQAQACRSLGSPFTAQLCELLAQNLDDSTRFGARIINWPQTAKADALALRAAGALHWLARSGQARELATLFPPLETKPDVLWEAIAKAIERHDDALYDFLDSPPQTNEVSRSSALLGMALLLSKRFSMPLAIYEIGASAGLNLAFDRYHYILGNGEEREWGDADSLVHIESAWRGHVPDLEVELTIASRAGCDRNPLDPHDPESVERQLSYVWADQHQRIARISAASVAAASLPYHVDKADAADWVEAKLAEEPEAGIVRVFFHTIVWQYLPEATKERITAAFEKAGAAASNEAPLVWMYMEAEDHPAGAVLKQRVWPGGELETVGLADYHGRWVDWA